MSPLSARCSRPCAPCQEQGRGIGCPLCRSPHFFFLFFFLTPTTPILHYQKKLHSKKKTVHKATATDDKRLQSTLKRLGVHAIGGIEEVALFGPGDGATVFASPRVQASIGSNTFVVSGPSQERSMEEMLPAMLGNLPPEALAALAAQVAGAGGRGAAGAAAGAGAAEEDEDVPELVEEIEDEKE
jgi:nascent polypeptide-associated complex subunit beta